MTLSSNTLRAVVCAAIVITAIPAGILTFSSTATAAVDGDVDIDPDDSSPSFDKDINAGREYEFDFVVSYNLPDGESGVINLYLADAGGRQIQKEVIGTGDYEDVTISVTEFVARERVGEGFYISTILRDSNDEFVEGDDKEYTVTAPGEPPSIDNATPPGDETVIVEKGETRTFEINASDPDGDDLDYTWRLRKEAVGSDYQKVGSGSTHSQTFDVELDDGNTAYRLQVEITDPYHSITYDWLIDVQKENNNRSPSVTRITPESSEFIANAGDDVQFEIEATDQDADLDRVDWYLNGDKQITRSFTNDVTTTDSKTFTFDTDGKHTVRAVVTDSNGNKDTATWNSALADLRVTNVELVPSDPAAGEPTDFRVKIQNIGDKPAETVTVNTFVDGELVGVPPATDLAPGESDKTVLTGDYKFDEGSHTVSAVVNPDNNIPESNKNNNKNTLETNIGAYDGYSVTLTDFDYSISASSHANSGVGRTENYNTSTTIKSKGIADVSVGSRAGPIVAQSSSQGVALVGAKWEAPHSGDTKVGLTSSTTGSATVTPDDYPLATNLGYSGRAVASQSIVIYDRTDNEIVKQSQTKLSDIKAPTTNEWLVDSAIKIVGTVGLGSTLSKKVGSKGGGFVAKGVADTVGGEIQSQLLSKAAGLVVNDDHTRKVDRKSSMVVSFEAEKGHEYAIYQRVSAGTGTLGITERAVGAEVDIKSDVEEIQIYTDEQTGGPPNLQISQTPSRYVSDPDNAVVEAQAEFSDDSDTTPEIGFRLVSPDGIQDDWLYQSSEIKRFSLGDLIDNVQPGEYVVEFQARDPRTGIESGVISVPVTVTSDPQVELGVTEETENGATLGMSIKSVAPVEHIELQTKQAGEWTSWQTVSPNLSPVYDSPGETMIRGRAIDVAGNRGEWNMVTVTVPDSSSVIADAGDDQTVTAGETVALDATGSSSPDQSELGYRFKQLSQPDSLPDVSLQDPETQTPEFTAPDVDSETTVTFELTVTNSAGTTTTDTDTDTDQVNITIIPADDEDADGMSADAALSFEQGDTGETPPAPWSIIRDPTAPGFEAVEISEQHATDGSQTLHMTGNGELDRILVGFDANLSNVETVRVDVYLERANVYIGEIWFGRRVDGESQKTVDVMGQTGEGPNRFGTTGEFTNVEGDVSDLSGEHELVFNVRGDNEAYFDEIEFLDADGNVVPAAQVVVEADNRGPPGGGDGDDSDELLSVPFKTSFETGLNGWTVNQRFRTGERREPGAGEFPQSILSRGDGEYSDQYDGSVRLGVNGGPSSIGVARNTSGIQNGTQISAKFNSDSFSGEPGRVRLLLYPPGEGNQNEIGLDSRGGQSDVDEVVLSGTVSEDYPPGTQIRLTADVWPGEYDIYVTNISAQVPADDPLPTTSLRFTDQTLPNGSSTVTVDTAQFGNESVPGEKFVVVVHKTTESIYDDEIGPKVGESDVLSPGTRQSVEVDLSQTLGPSDDMAELTESQSLVAMLHRADTTDGDDVTHGAHITRDGDKVTSRAQLTVSSSSPPALRTHRNLTSTEVTNGSTVTVTVEANFESSIDDAKLEDSVDGPGITRDNITIIESDGAFLGGEVLSGPRVDATYNDRLNSGLGSDNFTVEYNVTIPEDTPVNTTITFDGTVTNDETSQTAGIDGDSSVEVVATTSPDTVTVNGQEVPAEFTSETENGETTVTVDNVFDAVDELRGGDIDVDTIFSLVDAFRSEKQL